MTHLSGPTSLIDDEDLAPAVARQRLATIKTDNPAAPAKEAVRAARAVSVSMVEMERVTGFSRQTIYNHHDRARESGPTREELEIQILMVLASEMKEFDPSSIGSRLDLPDPANVQAAVIDLDRAELCRVEREKPGSTSIVAHATEKTFDFLRRYFESIYFRRPDAYMVSYDARGHDTRDLEDALKRVLSNPEDYALMSRELMPSAMVGPELGYYVYAATVPRVYEIAHRVWQEMLNDPEAIAPIREVLPPGNRRPQPSEILDAFVEALIAVDPRQAEQVTAARDAYVGGSEKVDLAGRCVRQAARAMRRAREIKEEPARIYDGDSAWKEVEIAEALDLEPPLTTLQSLAKNALWLASNNLGYFPGGGMSSMGQATRVSGGHPTNAQLNEMAAAAGAAVGEAAILGLLDPELAMLEVVFDGKGGVPLEIAT